MAFQHTRLCAFACAAALALRGSSAVNVASCADLAPFTTGDALTEDVSMFLEDSRFFTCEEVRVVTVLSWAPTQPSCLQAASVNVSPL